MNGSSAKLWSFAGAAGALGAAALVARVACPGSCVTCASCAQSVVPAVASAVAVGSALTGSFLIKRSDGTPARGSRRQRSASDE